MKLPQLNFIGPEKNKLLVVTWGSVYGPSLTAIEELQKEGYPVSMLNLKHLYPFQEDLGEILNKFEKILVPEMNLGQLSHLIRAEYLVDAISFSKLQGRPFLISEIREKIIDLLKNK